MELFAQSIIFANLTNLKSSNIFMDKELIIANEASNDGQTMHLYFNTEIGLYTAYGMSAFLASHIVEGYLTAFSEEYNLPVLFLGRTHIDALRRDTIKDLHQEHIYYKFTLKRPLGTKGYEKWIKTTAKM